MFLRTGSRWTSCAKARVARHKIRAQAKGPMPLSFPVTLVGPWLRPCRRASARRSSATNEPLNRSKPWPHAEFRKSKWHWARGLVHNLAVGVDQFRIGAFQLLPVFRVHGFRAAARSLERNSVTLSELREEVVG